MSCKMESICCLHEGCTRLGVTHLSRQNLIFPAKRWLVTSNRFSCSSASVVLYGSQPPTVNVLYASSVAQDVPSLQTEEETEDKEAIRRKRISLANKGNVPWNKGRRHSPETIAKIKARTAEAMQRPEVVAKVKAAAASNIGKSHSPETKAKIGEASKKIRETTKDKLSKMTAEEVEAMRLKRGMVSKAKWDDPEYREKTLAGIRKAAEERKAENKAKREAERLAAGMEPPRKLTPEERRAKLREAGRKAWKDPEFRERMRKKVVALLQKRHQEMTEEEKQAWREGQRQRARQQWSDPEYRAKTLSAIQARHAQIRAAAGDKPSSSRASKPSIPKPKPPTKKEQAARAESLRSMWQGRLALLAKTLRTMALLEQRLTDLTQLERALANDPQRHREAVQGITQASQCLTLARQKVKELTSSVPPFVKYDKLGNMISFDDAAALQYHAANKSAAAASHPAHSSNTSHEQPSDSPSPSQTAASSDPMPPLAAVLPTRNTSNSGDPMADTSDTTGPAQSQASCSAALGPRPSPEITPTQPLMVNGIGLQHALVNGASIQPLLVNGAAIKGASIQAPAVNGATILPQLMNGISPPSTSVNGSNLQRPWIDGAAAEMPLANGASAQPSLVNGIRSQAPFVIGTPLPTDQDRPGMAQGEDKDTNGTPLRAARVNGPSSLPWNATRAKQSKQGAPSGTPWNSTRTNHAASNNNGVASNGPQDGLWGGRLESGTQSGLTNKAVDGGFSVNGVSNGTSLDGLHHHTRSNVGGLAPWSNGVRNATRVSGLENGKKANSVQNGAVCNGVPDRMQTDTDARDADEGTLENGPRH